MATTYSGLFAGSTYGAFNGPLYGSGPSGVTAFPAIPRQELGPIKRAEQPAISIAELGSVRRKDKR